MSVVTCGKLIGLLIGMEVIGRLRWYTESLVSEKAKRLPIRNVRNTRPPAVFRGSLGRCRPRASRRLQPMRSTIPKEKLSVRPVFLPLLPGHDSSFPVSRILPRRQRTTFSVRRFFFLCKTKHSRLLLFLKNHPEPIDDRFFPVFHRVPA